MISSLKMMIALANLELLIYVAIALTDFSVNLGKSKKTKSLNIFKI